MSSFTHYKINKDPFVSAAKYVIENLAYLVSFYAVIGTKIIELKNTRFAFSQDSVVVYGDLDVEEEGTLNRIIINIYDKDNNLVASEDVRFEYEIKPGKYRVAFTVNTSTTREVVAKAPECEFIALPDPFVLKHPDLNVPIMYVGINRMFDYEATYFNPNTVTASVAVITSTLPYKAGMWYRYARYYTGYLGKIKMRTAGEIGPLYLGGPAIHKNLYTPFLGGYPYVIHINNSVIGIGKGSKPVPWYPEPNNNVFAQTFYMTNPGVYDIFTSIRGDSAPIGFSHLVIGFGKCVLDISTYKTEDLWMFGGAEVEVNGEVRYNTRLRMPAYIYHAYNFSCALGTQFLEYSYCTQTDYVYHDLMPAINRILSNPIVFDKLKNHPCIQFVLDNLKSGKQVVRLIVQYSAPSQSTDPETHHPLSKLTFYMGRVGDVRNYSYRIYIPIYTAGLRRIKIYFKGRISAKYAVFSARTVSAKLFSMQKFYWNRLADIISASGGQIKEMKMFSPITQQAVSSKVIDVSVISFSIPEVYDELFPMVIDYSPYVYSISDIDNVLVVHEWDTPFCYDVPGGMECYYNCVKNELPYYIYHKYRPYEVFLVVTLEDDNGNAYIPHVNGSVVFKQPDLFKDEILSQAPDEETRSAVASLPTYYWLRASIDKTGRFVDKTEANVPYLVANQAYDFLNRV